MLKCAPVGLVEGEEGKVGTGDLRARESGISVAILFGHSPGVRREAPLGALPAPLPAAPMSANRGREFLWYPGPYLVVIISTLSTLYFTPSSNSYFFKNFCSFCASLNLSLRVFN
jgi:hypothetical protein